MSKNKGKIKLYFPGLCQCVYVRMTQTTYSCICLHMYCILTYTRTVGFATKNDVATKECYKEQYLSIKSACYNEREGVLFLMESLIIVFTKDILLTLFMCVRLFVLYIRESLFIVFTKVRSFMLLKFIFTVYKS